MQQLEGIGLLECLQSLHTPNMEQEDIPGQLCISKPAVEKKKSVKKLLMLIDLGCI